MTSFKTTLLVSAMVLGCSTIANAQFGPPQNDFGGENGSTTLDGERYIIRYKNNGKSKIASDIKISKGQLKMSVERQNMVAAILDKKYARSLKNHPNIESIEIDPKRYLMAEETPYGIPMVQADQLSDAGTGNQTVCIMDTGYDRTHVDLQAVRVTGNNNNQTGPWYNDGDGHGTHVAGTIAALGGNNEGVVGVNPGNNLNLHIVKVFNNNGAWAYGSDLVRAVDQCTAAGATVINMSLGGEGASAAEEAAFQKAYDAGILSVAAAGNDGITALNYPASYDGVMSVAAVNSAGTVANWSQHNAKVEIAAPGVNVKSTVPGNQYDSYSGTSMASPHVAGVAALVWSHYPDCSAQEIRSALTSTAQDKGVAGRDQYYGFGIVKAKAAHDALAGGCDGGGTVTPPPPPTGDELENGVARTGLSRAEGQSLYFEIPVPAGASNLEFKLSGGTGDADLYVRKGAKPTLSAYDCRPYLEGNVENCTFATPENDTYFVRIHAYEAFSGVSLVATYSDVPDAPNEPPKPNFTYECDGLTCNFDASSSSDDGQIAKYVWNTKDNKLLRGETVSHTFSKAGTYSVILSTTDDDGVRRSKRQFITVEDGGVSIALRILKRQLETRNVAHPRWSSANGENVDIYFNGDFLMSTPNDGVWWHRHAPVPAVYRYRVCETDSTSNCSAEISVTFE